MTEHAFSIFCLLVIFFCDGRTLNIAGWQIMVLTLTDDDGVFMVMISWHY